MVSLLLLLTGGYGVLAMTIYLNQDNLVYFPNQPTRQVTLTPQAAGLDYDDVRIPVTDTQSLRGWYIPASQAKATVLFLHGNGGNISHRLDSIVIFHQLSLNVLIIDYRGYGESDGEPTEQGTYQDARAAWDYLVNNYGKQPQEIILFGRSLGAAIAAQLADQVMPRGLIVESAFTSIPDLASEFYPWLPVRWMSRYGYDTREYLQRYHGALLVVHSPDDDIIPFHHGQSLFAVANEPKRFLQISGGHNDGFYRSGELYINGVGEFIAAILP